MDDNASITIATERGSEAYWACVDLDDNPFPQGTPENEAWRAGYQQEEKSDN